MTQNMLRSDCEGSTGSNISIMKIGNTSYNYKRNFTLLNKTLSELKKKTNGIKLLDEFD